MHRVIERILNLLAFLLTKDRPVTADEIRHTVSGYDQPTDEAFRRTFERDKDLLRSLGVPLHTTPTDIWEVELGYVVPSEEYVLDDPGLTDDERRALLVAAETVRFGGETTSLAAIFKLGGSVGAGSLSFAPVSADLGHDLETLGLLFDAVDNRCHIRFGYRGRTRRVSPYGLLHRFGRWYVAGPETRDQELVKAFRIDRMDGIEVEPEPHAFERPDSFDPDDVLAGVGAPVPDLVASVRFDADVGTVAANRWRGARIVERDEEGFTIEAPYDEPDALITWVLGFDHRAEILAPESLRRAMREHLETIR